MNIPKTILLPVLLAGTAFFLNARNNMTIIDYNSLALALARGDKEITIGRNITVNHALMLPEGASLKGVPQEDGELPMLIFPSSDGIALSADNSVSNLKINAPAASRAIFTTYAGQDAGTFRLQNLSVQGQVAFIFRIGVKRAEVLLRDIDIFAADARAYLEQPQKYGVNVLQGALTIYNMDGDRGSLVKVRAEGITIGRRNAPVAGSGIFIAGAGDAGGRTEISLLQTGEVHSTGKIPYGVADYITGGVFILNGAHAQKVITDGELVTYGVNDMVTDVWGSVDEWTSNAPITSYGPSGIGFVNFGVVGSYTANAPVRTYGEGARGYNQYDGTVGKIVFDSIETFGNGSIGIQISKKIGKLSVRGGVATHGGTGNSLVKGVIMKLPAYAVSIKDGGYAELLEVEGDISTDAEGVEAYIKEEGGGVGKLAVGGKIRSGK